MNKNLKTFLALAEEFGVLTEVNELLEAKKKSSLDSAFISIYYSGKGEKMVPVGVKVGTMVITLKDSSKLLTRSEVDAFCFDTKVDGRPCGTFKSGDEDIICHCFEEVNKLLESIGGDTLKKEGYHTEDLYMGCPWIIGLHNHSSDFYGDSEPAWVRPVYHLS